MITLTPLNTQQIAVTVIYVLKVTLILKYNA